MEKNTVAVELGNVRWGAECIEEVQDQKTVLTVKRADLRHATLRHGFVARSPIIQGTLGMVMTILPMPLAVLMVRGWVSIYTVFACAAVLLGLWVIWDSLRRGFFMEVQTNTGQKKLVFGSSVKKEAVEKFAELLKERFGDIIETR